MSQRTSFSSRLFSRFLNQQISGVAVSGHTTSVLVGMIVVGVVLGIVFQIRATGWSMIFSVGGYALALAAALPLFMEHVVLRLLGNFRLGAVTRVTYYEALLQPFTLILMAVGIGTIVICAWLPFYTLSEDDKMYRDIASAFIQFFALAVMVYAAAKVVDEEIENRTMLTLMSKPINRWEVIIGKYLGVIACVGLVMAVLSIAVSASSYLRFFEDRRLDIVSADPAGQAYYYWENQKSILALLPTFVLQFLAVSTLAAIAVAVSTRWGLALNIAIIVAMYVVANLTRYVGTLGMPEPWNTVVSSASLALPFLNHFDLTPLLLYGTIRVGNEDLPKTVATYGQIWTYVGMASVYGLFYIGAALGLATMMFRTRELT